MQPHDGDGRAERARSRRRWNFWSSRWGLVERDSAGIRRETVEAAAIERGDVVLDIGCGPGVNFEMLRESVGPDGHVVGLDLSDGMVERARERVRERGWTNVEVVQADATHPPLRTERFDAAVATTALVAMPDIAAAVRGVHDALRPGARFAVYELRPVPRGPARVLNPLVRRFFRLFGNWNEEERALDVLAEVFGAVELLDEYALGTNVVAVTGKATE
ncbi:class I SAM-dependent methyltransferase [Halorarius halobius]|uniref:class I SAM-dependent methyltransferase n=1 Tax=Halorarius halobius TaxID=2962671 RepID=UPI0020CB9824|nr:methyltransferase domain-containing protein [Halorarius halobius]